MTAASEARLTARSFGTAYREALSRHVREPGEATLREAFGDQAINLHLVEGNEVAERVERFAGPPVVAVGPSAAAI